MNIRSAHHPPVILRRRAAFVCQPPLSTIRGSVTAESMLSFYHLRPAPSRLDCGICTRSASPEQQIISFEGFLAMGESVNSTCCCGEQLVDRRDRCPACFQHHQKRLSRRSGQLQPPAQTLTPPPSESTTPRTSLEADVTASSRPCSTRRNGSITDSLNEVFSSDETVRIFSPSFGREPSRSRSRRRRAAIPSPPSATAIEHRPTDTTSLASASYLTPTTASRPPLAYGSHAPDLISRSSRPVTPERGALDRSYSPMAAGFARLSRKDAYQHLPTERRGRVNAGRSSLEMEAQMFDGPA